jgi:ABC-type Fe3+-citrate transport system substrate-binding protein
VTYTSATVNVTKTKILKNSIFIIASFIVSTFIITSCDKSSQNQEQTERSLVEANREMDISRNEVIAEIQTFRIEMAGKIMENNRSIAEIKKKINKDDTSSEKINEARIAELQSESRELKRIIDNYNDLSRHNWDKFKSDFTGEMNDLGQSLYNFFEISETAN